MARELSSHETTDSLVIGAFSFFFYGGPIGLILCEEWVMGTVVCMTVKLQFVSKSVTTGRHTPFPGSNRQRANKNDSKAFHTSCFSSHSYWCCQMYFKCIQNMWVGRLGVVLNLIAWMLKFVFFFVLLRLFSLLTVPSLKPHSHHNNKNRLPGE